MDTPKSERNFKIKVSYDGTAYSGWQRQKNGLAIQEVLEKAVGKVCGHPVVIFGSGRTDAGVHAEGQIASFFTAADRTPRQLVFGSNSLLPGDVAILEAEEAPPEFNARFSCTGKKYSYDFLISPIRKPLYHQRSWFVGNRLRWDIAEECLRHLIGEKDFACFRTMGSDVKSTTRKIFAAVLSDPEPNIRRLELTGSGFLRNMARSIAGSVYEIGRGRIKASDFPKFIESKNRALMGHAAPPQGLCLREVYYEDMEVLMGNLKGAR
jgi:tRNA pseudouridine38-40 synthase